MAIYNPPKGNNWGEALQLAGATTSAVGGVATATGVGAPVGIALAAGGMIMSGIGGMMNANEEKKAQAYSDNYQARLQGENSMKASIANNRDLKQSMNNLQSLSGINNY